MIGQARAEIRSIKRRFQLAREEAGYGSAYQAAPLMGMSRRSLYAYENPDGGSLPGTAALVAMSKLYGESVDWMLCRTDVSRPVRRSVRR